MMDISYSTDYYYKPHSSCSHDRLTYDWERPTFSIPGPGMSLVPTPGPRTRIIIEGENDFVDRVRQAMEPTLAEIRAELNP